MKKLRTFLTAVLLSLAVCALFAFAGCGTTEEDDTIDTGDVTEHTHTYSTSWSYDEAAHWYDATCSEEDDCATAVSDYAAHSDDDADGTCDVCGATTQYYLSGTGYLSGVETVVELTVDFVTMSAGVDVYMVTDYGNFHYYATEIDETDWTYTMTCTDVGTGTMTASDDGYDIVFSYTSSYTDEESGTTTEYEATLEAAITLENSVVTGGTMDIYGTEFTLTVGGSGESDDATAAASAEGIYYLSGSGELSGVETVVELTVDFATMTAAVDVYMVTDYGNFHYYATEVDEDDWTYSMTCTDVGTGAVTFGEDSASVVFSYTASYTDEESGTTTEYEATLEATLTIEDSVVTGGALDIYGTEIELDVASEFTLAGSGDLSGVETVVELTVDFATMTAAVDVYMVTDYGNFHYYATEVDEDDWTYSMTCTDVGTGTVTMTDDGYTVVFSYTASYTDEESGTTTEYEAELTFTVTFADGVVTGEWDFYDTVFSLTLAEEEDTDTDADADTDTDADTEESEE